MNDPDGVFLDPDGLPCRPPHHGAPSPWHYVALFVDDDGAAVWLRWPACESGWLARKGCSATLADACSGKLVGEREVIGGSKERYRVRLDAPETLQEASETLQTVPPTRESGDAPETPQESTTTLQDASAIARTLDIMDALLKANAETMDRQTERLEKLHDLLWQETARAASAEARAKLLQAELERVRAEAGRPWWRKALGLPPA